MLARLRRTLAHRAPRSAEAFRSLARIGTMLKATGGGRGMSAIAAHLHAREFAKAELANHRYVMVLHTHQANPHVHISVRAEGRDGSRLNSRKGDLRRWRETFAERLRSRGIEAEASSQEVWGSRHRDERVWSRKRVRDTGLAPGDFIAAVRSALQPSEAWPAACPAPPRWVRVGEARSPARSRCRSRAPCPAPRPGRRIRRPS